jgi:hypothetical protein
MVPRSRGPVDIVHIVGCEGSRPVWMCTFQEQRHHCGWSCLREVAITTSDVTRGETQSNQSGSGHCIAVGNGDKAALWPYLVADAQQHQRYLQLRLCKLELSSTSLVRNRFLLELLHTICILHQIHEFDARRTNKSSIDEFDD